MILDSDFDYVLNCKASQELVDFVLLEKELNLEI